MPQKLASLKMLEVKEIHSVTLMMGINEVSRSEARKMMKLPEKVSCFLAEIRIYLDLTVLTILTVPYNMRQDENSMNMNERVRHIIDILREAQNKSILPLRLLDVAWMMENSSSNGFSSNDIHFDRPKGVEWLNCVFERHIKSLDSDLLKAGHFTFGPHPRHSSISFRPISDRLGERIHSRDSSVSSSGRQPGSIPLEKDVTKFSTPKAR